MIFLEIFMKMFKLVVLRNVELKRILLTKKVKFFDSQITFLLDGLSGCVWYHPKALDEIHPNIQKKLLIKK